MSLFRWFTRRPAAEPPLLAPGMSLDQGLAAIAGLRNELAIQDAARQFPRQFGPEVIPELRRRFDALAEPPPSFAAREPSASAWIACWHATLYEVLYQYREHALPALRDMARAGHTRAAVLLCRLAAQGIDRDGTVEDLRAQLAQCPPALLTDVAAELRARARMEPALAAIVEDLRQAPAFEAALAEVNQFGDEC